MPKIRPTHQGGVGPLTLLDATSSTGPGAEWTLSQPMTQWSIYCTGTSTDFVVNLQGTLDPSTSASWTTLENYQASSVGSGVTLVGSSWAYAVFTRVRCVLDSGASSGGVTAYVTAAP